MKLTIELDLEHVGDTGRDDAERVADFVFYNHLDGQVINAGNHGEARYEIRSFSYVGSETEVDADGNDLDVLPETVS